MQFDFYDIITILSAYLIGNISPAIILGKINGIDIKKEGSGNAGTDNTAHNRLAHHTTANKSDFLAHFLFLLFFFFRQP